jgi:hypothetical protein
MNIERENTMTRNTAPADFTFHFVATDAHTYPVTVEFQDRLPCIRLEGVADRNVLGERTTIDGRFRREFDSRAGINGLHVIMPRKRMIVTIDRSDAETRNENGGIADRDRRRALYDSASNLADQLFIALQARRF